MSNKDKDRAESPVTLPARREQFDEEEGEISVVSSSWSESGHQDKESGADKIKIAQSESQNVFRARIMLVGVLILVAGTICSGVYVYAHHQEKEMFRSKYYELASKVADTIESMATRRVNAIENLAVTISSNAMSRQQTWPNVTVDDFETRLSYTLDLAAVVGIIFVPFVTGEARKGWEEYSVQNQGWLRKGLLQEKFAAVGNTELDLESIATLEKTWGTSPNLTIPEEIFGISGTGSMEETGDGPYAPWWQFAPVFPVPNLVNYNMLSHPSRTPNFRDLIEDKLPLISEAWDYADISNPNTVGKKAALNLFLNRRQEIALNYQDGPVSDLYFPIFEEVHSGVNSSTGRAMQTSTNQMSANPSRVVGALSAYIYWQVYFHNVLPQGTREIVAVLENTCGQQFSYSVNGEDVQYVGQGDLHDPSYDDLVVSTGWNAFLKHHTETTPYHVTDHCSYQVRIYPTEDLESDYVTSQPLSFAFVLISAFVLTSLVFIVYDLSVERRNRIVMKKAVESTEVVNTLYPAAVRDRLFDDNKNQTHRVISKNAVESGEQDDDDNEDGIIADLFEDATVMFADLAGFTEWSDGRPPKQVFRLLETLFGCFDEIAKRRSVFKIETIGDCYLAVCGIPTPNDKHALIMARFAAECIFKMEEVIQKELVDALGEDTAELKLRIGLNSGCVTAGVLRGSRARYQLFGDTVNTASRMESNGTAGKIQASEATANLLVNAGKGDWLTEREGGIYAKGKGHLRAFWVQPKGVTTRSFTSSSTVSSVAEYETGDPTTVSV